MRISVFGLGYVGAVSVACLANDGHTVIGVDPNQEKVDLIKAGKSPIIEPGLNELLFEYASTRIIATTSCNEAVDKSEIAFISVGTPTAPNGEPDLSFVYHVCKEIAIEVSVCTKEKYIVVLRSTVPPGTVAQCQRIVDEVVGENRIVVAFNPEFLREGSAINDYYNPAYTIIGTTDQLVEDEMRRVYSKIDAPFFVTEIKVAEMVKYVANTWHAVKIVFANEIGRLSGALNIPGIDVMKLIVQDTKLSASAAYLKPGFAYGGSCLPKDVRGMKYLMSGANADLPLISSIEVSNEEHINQAFKDILNFSISNRKVVILGLAFKPNTDDLRESPSVKLIKKLMGEGLEIKVYDPYVKAAFLLGTNLQYIRTVIPHFERLLITHDDLVFDKSDILVFTYKCQEFLEIIERNQENQKLDLSGSFTFG